MSPQSNARRELFNALPNVFWTALLVGPVYLFCSRHLSVRSICWFVLIGVLPLALPKKVLQRLALSPHIELYRRLRVPLLLGLTQDGAWLRRIGGSPGARVRRERDAITRVLRDTFVRERFHWGAFLFCTLCASVAIFEGHQLWFVVLIFINIFYNLYPIWLQQYLRLRLTRLLNHQCHSRRRR